MDTLQAPAIRTTNNRCFNAYNNYWWTFFTSYNIFFMIFSGTQNRSQKRKEVKCNLYKIMTIFFLYERAGPQKRSITLLTCISWWNSATFNGLILMFPIYFWILVVLPTNVAQNETKLTFPMLYTKTMPKDATYLVSGQINN